MKRVIHLFYKLFFYFYFYSFLGWISETIYCSILSKRLVKRGVLFEPLCPVYGLGAIFIIYGLPEFYLMPFCFFILSVVGTSIIEYVSHFLLERILQIHVWDYSNKKVNLNGRICLLNSVLFGIMSLIMIYGIHPFIATFLSSFSTNPIVFSILFTFFLFDVIVMCFFLYHYRMMLNGTIQKDGRFPYLKQHFQNIEVRK